MMQVRLLLRFRSAKFSVSVATRLSRLMPADCGDPSRSCRRGECRAFSQDLYYRLNVVAIEVPSLRQRGKISLCWLAIFCSALPSVIQGGKRFYAPGDGSVDSLRLAGNIRELENAVERAVVLLTGDIFPNASCRWRLPVRRSRWGKSGYSAAGGSGKRGDSGGTGKTGGNKTEAARQLGITRKTYWQNCRVSSARVR